MSLWALMFHMKMQSKYVLESEVRTGRPSFINPLAEEILRVMSGVIKTDYILTNDNRVDIIEYMNSHITPIVNTRKISPPVLLLATINELYDIEFIPCYDILGSGVVRDFTTDFINRTSNSPELDAIYKESCAIIKTIIHPKSIPFVIKNKIKNLKEEFNSILEKSYGNSLSHGWSHIDDVLSNAIYYATKYNIEVDYEELILAVLLHDIFNDDNRKEHHELAAKWVESSIHPIFKDKQKRARIANAIREHRASYSGEYYSTISELLATADREVPDLIKIIERMYMYRLDINPKEPHKEIMTNILCHLRDKYSRVGYIQYTNMYVLENGQKLKDMMDTIDRILIKKLVIKISNIAGKILVNIKRK